MPGARGEVIQMRQKRNRGPYLMDFIPDRALFKAVLFACSLIRNGTYPPDAFKIAAGYYDVSPGDINYYVCQRSVRSRARRRAS